ncbi:hypothetical protein [Niastella populi]|uniref:Uncharacterized protein n=1 Tax=Niastella populi TaxID=550983 RepID=A0A1V9G6M4_9BACT|nr:hypothetical protein [Niastella populi]OQP66194.1 hypothetical protein A4R26_13975 [Niastella populi]
MALVPQKLSVTARQTINQKRRIRLAALPCFCKLPNEARPFFRQWHIHAIDVSKINSISYADARQMMQQVRNYYGKSRRDVITIEEFSEYTGKSKSLVRMVVVSRTIEQELKRQCNLNGKTQLSNYKPNS